jgi:hypothetical protein
MASKAWVTRSIPYLQVMPGIFGLFMFGHIVFPVVWNIVFEPNDSGSVFGFDSNTVFIAVTIYLVFLLMWLVGYWQKAPKHLAIKLPPIDDLNKLFNKKRGVVLLAIIYGSWLYLFIIKGSIYNVGVEKAFFNNALTLADTLFRTFSGFAMPSFAVLLAQSIQKQDTRKIIFFGALFLFMLVLAITGGTRAALINPLMMLAAGLFMLRKKEAVLSVMAVSFIALLLLATLLGAYRTTEAAQTGSMSEKFYAMKDVSKEQGVFNSNEVSTSWWQKGLTTVALRGDGVMSTCLMINHLQSTNNYAYFKPYQGVVLALVPRFIWKNKPVPNSIDGTKMGLPATVLWRLKFQNGIGGLSAFGATVMYWQFGWLGVIIGAFFVGLLCRTLVVWLFPAGTIGMVYLLMVIQTSVVSNVGVSLDYLLMFIMSSLVPLGIVATAWRLVRKRQYYRQKHQPTGTYGISE